MIDDEYSRVPSALAPRVALRHDPVVAMLGAALANPFVLGLVIALLAVLMIVFGPSTDSRFIYTDF
jgi:hypothetical protein